MRKIIDECFFQIQNGANIKQGKVDGGFPITRIETIANDRFNRDRMGYAGITDLSKYESYILEDEDLLMSHINSMQYLGRTVLYKKQDDEIIIHGMNLLRLRANRDIIIPGYAKYYFYGHSFRSQLRNIMKKSVNQASFAVKDLKKIKMEIPCLREQQKLVQVLDKIQKIIDVKTKEIAKFDELVSARFVEMFGDPITNSKLLPIEKIEERYFLKAGITTKAEDIHDYLKDKYEIPCYGGNGIRGYVENLSYEGCYPIIGRQGALCGNVQYATGKFHATEHAVLVSILKNDNTMWVYYMLKLMDLYRYHTGAAQPGLAVKKLNTIDVIVADINLQNQFATFVHQVNKSKFVIHKFLYCTTHNTKSIIKPRLNTKESGKIRGGKPHADEF
ncbi:restriction endonuclease subunit S [Anaerostipes hadrus]|uniref:restriction endonuclease subunit S n=1 Tax=Anaerostipes hadrus TaxID=649756 RepID=UPI000984ADD2|nr:restriction endonuclease subunit S [Anaerostipes hadrus]